MQTAEYKAPDVDYIAPAVKTPTVELKTPSEIAAQVKAAVDGNVPRVIDARNRYEPQKPTMSEAERQALSDRIWRSINRETPRVVDVRNRDIPRKKASGEEILAAFKAGLNGEKYVPKNVEENIAPFTFQNGNSNSNIVTIPAKDVLNVLNFQHKNNLTSEKRNDRIREGELFRKQDISDKRKGAFLSNEAFNRLTIEARKKGANIMRGGEDIERHLDAQKAGAAIIGDTLLFREKVTISEVLEETYHFNQTKNGINADKPEPLRTYLNEIEAKQYLLKNATKYKIPRSETEETKIQLEKYIQKLLEFLEGEQNGKNNK